MAKKKAEKLTPIPVRARPALPLSGSPASPARDSSPAAPAGPDLSHIDEALRPLAVECSSIDFDPENTRRHDENNIASIKGSLRKFGQTKNLVVRRSNRVVAAGNGTLAAALSLGWTHIAVNMKELDDAAARAYSIADNRSSDLSDFDDDALRGMLAALPATDDPDLDRMMDDLKKEIAPAATAPVAEADASAKEQEAAHASRFTVVVDCDDEKEQDDLLQRFTSEGFKCRAMTVEE
jgi:ParB-like chromosome segregation protein Spo0J